MASTSKGLSRNIVANCVFRAIFVLTILLCFTITMKAEKMMFCGLVSGESYGLGGISAFNLVLKTYPSDNYVSATVEFDLFIKTNDSKKYKREKFSLDYEGYFSNNSKTEISLSTDLMKHQSDMRDLARIFSYLCFEISGEAGKKFIQCNGNCGNIIYGFESATKIRLPKKGPFWTGSFANDMPDGNGFLLVPGTDSKRPDLFYANYGTIINNQFEGNGLYFHDNVIIVAKYVHSEFQGPGRIFYPEIRSLSDAGNVYYYLVNYEAGQVVREATGLNKYNGVVEKCDVKNGKWICQTLIEKYDHDKAVLGNLIMAGSLAIVETGALVELANQLSGPGKSGSSRNETKQKTKSEVCWDVNSIKQAKNCGSGFKELCYEGGAPVFEVKCSSGSNKYYYKSKSGFYYEYISLAADRQLPSEYNTMLKDLCGCK